MQMAWHHQRPSDTHGRALPAFPPMPTLYPQPPSGNHGGISNYPPTPCPTTDTPKKSPDSTPEKKTENNHSPQYIQARKIVPKHCIHHCMCYFVSVPLDCKTAHSVKYPTLFLFGPFRKWKRNARKNKVKSIRLCQSR